MTLSEYLFKHGTKFRWIDRLKKFASLQDAWSNCESEDLVWLATRDGILTERELRLFAIQCARSVMHLTTSQTCIEAIDVAEQYAHGNTTKEKLISIEQVVYRISDSSSNHARYLLRQAEFDKISSSEAALKLASAFSSADQCVHQCLCAGRSILVSAYSAAGFASDAICYSAAVMAYLAMTEAEIPSRDALRTSRYAQAEWLRRNTKPTFPE